MNIRRKSLAVASALSIALLALTGCGGAANVTVPTPLPEIVDPAVRMQTVWRTDGGSGTGAYGSGFKLAVDAHKLYVANSDGEVTAISLANGEHVWQTDTGLRLISGPSLAGDTLLIGTRDGLLLALSANDGQELWRANVSSEVLAAPAANGETAVVRTLDGRLVAYELASGDRLWTAERSVPTLTMRGASSPVISGDTVYAGLDNGHVIALDLATGEQRWEQQIAIPSGRSELERIVDIDAGLLLAGNELYAVSAGGQLASLSLTSGRVRWQQQVAAETGLALGARQVFTGDLEDVVWAVNRLTGATSWQQDALRYRDLSAPVVYDGYLLVGDYEGYLHWLTLGDGEVVARAHPVDTAIRTRPVVVGDMVVVLGSDGQVTAMRAASPNG